MVRDGSKREREISEKAFKKECAQEWKIDNSSAWHKMKYAVGW